MLDSTAVVILKVILLSKRDPAIVHNRVGIYKTVLPYTKEAAISKVHACIPAIIPQSKIPVATVSVHARISKGTYQQSMEEAAIISTHALI